MHVYVAGKWEEKERVREVQRQLIAAGHTITHDWTREVEGANYAQDDKRGVLTADAFVGVFEKDLKYNGALTEMGMAVAINIPIYVLGNAINSNVFMRLPEVRRGLDGLCS